MFYRFKSFSRIALSLAIVAAVIVIGSVGFMVLEGYTPAALQLGGDPQTPHSPVWHYR